MEFTPIQPPENFDLWLMEYHNETIKNIYNEIAPYKSHIPNFEYFVYNFFDTENGFFNCLGVTFLQKPENLTLILEISSYIDSFLMVFDNLTNGLEPIEKTIYYKILEYYISKDRFSENTLKELKRIYKGNETKKTLLKVLKFKYQILNKLHKYFELKFNQNKHILPFTIHYKKTIIVENDENPDLNWFIMKNTDANRTIPNYPELITEVRQNENTLNWSGSQTEFIELIKALIENKNIKGTQTEIISKLSNVFNIEIKNPNKLITDIKNRNNGSETLFLTKLQNTLFNYITRETKK